MRKVILCFAIIITCLMHAQAQGLPFATDTVVRLPCGQACTTLHAPLLVSTTSTYTANAISFYPPDSFNSGRTVALGTDDFWSPLIQLPFNFCFFGNSYDAVVLGSNGVLSFDTVNANLPYASFSITGPFPFSGEHGDLYNSILGPYQDMDNTNQGSIFYETGGTAPHRYFKASWYNMAMYGDSASNTPGFCYEDDHQTQMIVIYETTNVIEVYIRKKGPICDDAAGAAGPWNGGFAVEGVQNSGGTVFIGVPGRNATQWSAVNDAWRFTPAGPPGLGTGNYAWYLDSTFLGSGDSMQVCPPADTAYTVYVNFTACSGSPVSAIDTIRVLLNADTVAPSLSIAINTTFCSPAKVSFSASTVSGGDSASFQWKVNGNNAGANSSVFVDSTPVNGDIISCILTSSLTCVRPQTASSNPVTINLNQGLEQQSLCMVSCNPAGSGNIIIWDTVNKYSADTFYIYRCVTPDTIYQQIAAIPGNLPAGFYDISALAGQMSYRYKINLLDTCGHYSACSNFHQSMYLEYAGSGNFQFTPYVIENEVSPVTYYQLYRDTTGNGNWQFIAAVQNTQITINDPEYALFRNAWYQIRVMPDFVCNPSQPVSTVYSNTLVLHQPLSVSFASTGNIRLIPNPAHNQFEVVNTNPAMSVQSLAVLDPLGNNLHLAYTFTSSGRIVVDLNTLSSGLYFVDLHFAVGNEVLKLLKY